MIQIRSFDSGDFSAVQRIYQAGIDTGNATFETHVKSWPDWDAAMLPVCRLVAVEVDRVVGVDDG
jgi:phosphinothricin acetyltransferase